MALTSSSERVEPGLATSHAPRPHRLELGRRVVALGLLLLPMLGGCSAPFGGRVIAHRGASAYLPEHTLAAYALAYEMGAGWLEPDVVLTRDGALLCSHDLVLHERTDIASRFPGRAREDGFWYAIDFDLEELRSLSVAGDPAYRLATLGELLQLVQRLNASSGREVGVIPEPKAPSFHSAEGQPIEGPLLMALDRHGYRGAEDAAIVQCFELESLRCLRDEHGSTLRLVFLTDQALDAALLAELSGLCHGVGVSRSLVEAEDGGVTDLVQRAHAAGLAVYVWTFGVEEGAMTRFLHRHGVDGVFTDAPDAGLRAARRRGGRT